MTLATPVVKALPQSSAEVAWMNRHGIIPKGWKVHRLKAVAQLSYGDALATEVRQEGQVQVYGSNGAVGTHMAPNTLGPCIVVGRKGSFGKLNYSNDPVFVIDTAYFIDARSAQVHLRWLYYALQTLDLDLLSQDTGVPGLNREDALSRPIAVPSSHEQTLIANYLDRRTSRLDDLISKLNHVLNIIVEKRLAIISRAVIRGLDRSASLAPSNITWMSDVPAHWAVEPIGARYEVQLGKMLDQKQATGDVARPYLRNTNVQWGRIDTHDLLTMEFDEVEQRKFALRPGDLLVCEGGDVGRAALWEGQLEECYYQKALHRLRPLREGDNPRFLYYQMFAASKLGVFLADGNKSTIIHLTAVKLRRTRMPFPSAMEQATIVEFLDREIGKLDQLAAKIRQQLDLVREHRAALITAAVTGQIDMRVQAQP